MAASFGEGSGLEVCTGLLGRGFVRSSGLLSGLGLVPISSVVVLVSGLVPISSVVVLVSGLVPISSVVVLVSGLVPISSVVVLVSVLSVPPLLLSVLSVPPLLLSVPPLLLSVPPLLLSVPPLLFEEPSDTAIGYQNPRSSSKQTSSTPGILVTVYVIMNTWSLPTSIWCPR